TLFGLKASLHGRPRLSRSPSTCQIHPFLPSVREIHIWHIFLWVEGSFWDLLEVWFHRQLSFHYIVDRTIRVLECQRFAVWILPSPSPEIGSNPPAAVSQTREPI